MAKHLIIIPLVLLCVSAASGQSKKSREVSEEVYICRPQKPLSYTWICIDQDNKERHYTVREK